MPYIPHSDTMYLIFPLADFMALTPGQRNGAILKACEANEAAMRRNNDNTKAILKFNRDNWKAQGHPPTPQINPLLPFSTIYTRDELMVELAKPEWNSEEPYTASSSSSSD